MKMTKSTAKPYIKRSCYARLTALALTIVLLAGGLLSACSVKTTDPDNVQTQETEAPTPAPTPVPETEMYMIAPEPNSLMECYIIKTKEGKLIVIDGGIDGEGYDKPPYILAALRAVAGKNEGEDIEVEAWFLSHAHKDHFNELSKVLKDYSADTHLKINNFYFDFPPYGTKAFSGNNPDLPQLKELMAGLDNYAAVNGIAVPEGKSYYDVLNGSVANAETIAAGLDITIDELRFEIMQTWDKSDGSDINSSSLVFRMHAGEKTVLFLHDLGDTGGRRLNKKYGAELKSDIVHMAHHGQNGVSKNVYTNIAAETFLWSTPIWVWNDTKTYNIGVTRKWVNNKVDFTEASEHHIVACLFTAYPSDPTSIAAWREALPAMKVDLN